jgi:hypothetical protein
MANTDERSYIKLTGVSSQLKDDLVTISKNSGLTLSAFLKAKLRDIVEMTPPQLRRKAGS